MTINISELKDLLYNSVGLELEKIDFSVDKSKTWYTKKVGAKNKVKCFLATYNYLPQKIEYSFIIQFYLSEIDRERKRFCDFTNSEFVAGPTITLSEGYFLPALEKHEPKWQNAFTHVIKSQDDVSLCIEESLRVLNQYLIPGINTFSHIDMFQSYLIANIHRIGKSPFLLPALIALNLLGKDYFLKAFSQVRKDIDIESLPSNNLTRKLLEGYGEFVSQI